MGKTFTVAITGASGLIGSRLRKHFESKKQKVIPISRGVLSGSPEELIQIMEQADAVINLAGAPIIKRWTTKYKNEIYNSRIQTTRKIVQAIEVAVNRPALLISASAVGIYDQVCVQDEHSNQFSGDFLGKVCIDWEAEADKAATLTRLAIVRLGIVLAREGGALKTMLLPFKIGLGGKIATGRQPFAWIHIDDVISAIDFIIENQQAKGIYNLVAPGLINNRQFSTTFGKALKRPAWLPVPEFALRLLFGEAAVTLTGGQKVVPMRLEKAGFQFQYPEIYQALLNLL